MADDLHGAPPQGVRREGDDGLEEFELSFASMREFEEQFGPWLSGDGLFIGTEFPPDNSTVLRFKVCLPDDFVLIQGTGVVVWTRTRESDPESSPGVAVRFASLAPGSKETIDQVVAKAVSGGDKPFDLERLGLEGAPAAEEGLPAQAPPAPPAKPQPRSDKREAPKARFTVKAPGKPAKKTAPPAAPVEPPAPAPAKAPPPAQPAAPATPSVEVKPAGEPAPEQPAPAAVAPPQQDSLDFEPEVPAAETAAPAAESDPEELDAAAVLPSSPDADAIAQRVAEEQKRQLLVGAEPEAEADGLDWDKDEVAPAEPAAEAAPANVDDQVETWAEDPAALTWDEPSTDALEAAVAGAAEAAEPATETETETEAETEAETGPEAEPGPDVDGGPPADDLSLDIGQSMTPDWGAGEDPGPEWSAPGHEALPEAEGPGVEFDAPEPAADVAAEPSGDQPETEDAAGEEEPVGDGVAVPDAEPEPAAEAPATAVVPDLDPVINDAGTREGDVDETPRATGAGRAPEVTIAPTASAARRTSGGSKKPPAWLFILLGVIVIGVGGYWAVDRFVLSQGPESGTDPVVTRVEPTEAPDEVPTEPAPDDAAVGPDDAQVEPTAVPAVEPTRAPTPRPQPTRAPVATGARANVVRDIGFTTGAGTTTVVIEGNGAFTGSSVSTHPMESPPRVLVKVKGIAEPYKPYQITVDSPELSRIRVGHHPEFKPPALYVVLDLVGEGVAVQNVAAEGSTIRITLGR